MKVVRVVEGSFELRREKDRREEKRNCNGSLQNRRVYVMMSRKSSGFEDGGIHITELLTSSSGSCILGMRWANARATEISGVWHTV